MSENPSENSFSLDNVKVTEKHSENSTNNEIGIKNDSSESELKEIGEITTVNDNDDVSKSKNATEDEKKEESDSSISIQSNEYEKYAEHLTYSEDGIAIYTDPDTKVKYKWSAKNNNWLLCDNNTDITSSTADTVNLYENSHYKWCNETQQWIPKLQDATATATVTETEHYKWDAVKNEWIPKAQLTTTTTTASSSTASLSTEETTNVNYSIDDQGQRIFTDKDGVIYFWDTEKNAWFPKIDDDFMARYQMNYGFIDNTSESEEAQQKKLDDEVKRKKEELQRMTDEAAAAINLTENTVKNTATASTDGKRKQNQAPAKWFDIDPKHNTKVYVSNLPLNITIDEFAELMGKCGMIMRDAKTQKYKLKLYTESDGQIKGDGLCDYIKVESVDLALKILDEYNLRGNNIRVQRAKFQMRGEYNPTLKPKHKKKDKEKLQKMKEKLFDWRPEKMRGERSKNEKTVIIKNLFEPEIFEKEVHLILDYQNDLREECSKYGTVRKVIIYDRHPEGIAQINMSSPEEADTVIELMHRRFFGKRQLEAEHWDGKTKYKILESEKEAQQRLDKWDEYLEKEEQNQKNDS